MRQLILPVQLRDDATFENYVEGKNSAIIQYFKNPTESFIFLTGPGRTHLLQAVCHEASHAFYISLGDHEQYSPQILENLGELEWVIIDDIEAIAGLTEWEEAIFHAFNSAKHHFVVASHFSPALLAFDLPDLKSRLQSMLLLTLEDLSDQEKMAALEQRAHRLGIPLSKEVQQYLLHHAPRDLTALFQILQKLATLSLSEKRRLTIPFVKNVLCKT